jgi:NitT/TauT family transport system substrate-binding protein
MIALRRGILSLVVALFILSFILPVMAEDGVLKIGYQPSIHQTAYMLAQDKGWWERDLAPFGITKVEEYQFASGPPEMQAMIAGYLDVAYTGSAPSITAIAQGLDAKIVAAANIQGSRLALWDPSIYKGPKS